jgi:hypothetical protein
VKKLTQLAEEHNLCTFLVKGRAGERLDKILYQKFKKYVARPSWGCLLVLWGANSFYEGHLFRKKYGHKKKCVF